MTSHSRGKNSFDSYQKIKINQKAFHYHSLNAAEQSGLTGVHKLPFSLRLLLENLLRHENGRNVTRDDINAVVQWLDTRHSQHEIAFYPTRVLMQDFTGVPAVADLAAMRDAVKAQGKNPEIINPLCPIDLVVDHSVQVDDFGNAQAFSHNVRMEMQRNEARYTFLRWGQKALKNFRVVPPGTGICHQVNLEYLAQVVWHSETPDGTLLYPDTLVGTDSHTTMINGLGILGWGVGGIEAEAVALGQPITMRIPDVVGVALTGQLPSGATATDLVLKLTQILRRAGVVGKFVEFYGPGLQHLSLAQRATIANMAPEYGATCGLFPIDQAVIDYLRLTARSEEQITLVETYAKAQGFWHDAAHHPTPCYTQTLSLDLNSIQPCVAGPKNPQATVPLPELPAVFNQWANDPDRTQHPVPGTPYHISHGHVVIAAITSCTNTSNPRVLMMAGLLAKNAIQKGLMTQPWVKTSLAPGSKVVTSYLEKAGLMPFLEQLGFHVVGYGCTTCIGNSGPLEASIEHTIKTHQLTVSAVLSGNRNFEGRIHPQVKANWLASPPLVIAYALLGNTRENILTCPLGTDPHGNPVFLKDIWPSEVSIEEAMHSVRREFFAEQYQSVFLGDATWQALPAPDTQTYQWDPESTYVQCPPFFSMQQQQDRSTIHIANARILAIFGDHVTTDHISPAGSIDPESPAGQYLIAQGVTPLDFNSYGARRGNHEVMIRGTFANLRIRNEVLPEVEGGFCLHPDTQAITRIYDAAMAYQQKNTPLIIIAGTAYGTGSSRDWAAKGTRLLGIQAVIAESFERIHRANLVGMGVLPLCFPPGVTRKSLQLHGQETLSITGNTPQITPHMAVSVLITDHNGRSDLITLECAIETQDEVQYYQHGHILNYVLQQQVNGTPCQPQ